MNAKLVISLALILALQLQLATAWWCTGHMLTSLIAIRQLNSSTVYDQVYDIVKYISTDYPNSPEPIAAACWADDLRDVENNQAQFQWHFIDYPYVRDVLSTGSPRIDIQNVVWAINQATSLFNVSNAHPTKLDQSMFLRFLIHFLGDIHQPLHTASLFDDVQFPAPDGDQGGNLFPISGSNVTELHAFWDSGAGLWDADPVRPLNSSALEYLNTWATTLTTVYPPSSLVNEVKITDPAQWARESHKLAVTVAYNLQPGDALSSTYIRNARELVFRQVALGGYRLANLLNTLFA